jgi:hypothetical protein
MRREEENLLESERRRNETHLVHEIEKKRAQEREALMAMMQTNRLEERAVRIRREEEEIDTIRRQALIRAGQQQNGDENDSNETKRDGPVTEETTEEDLKRQAERKLRSEQILKRKEERRRAEDELRRQLEEVEVEENMALELKPVNDPRDWEAEEARNRALWEIEAEMNLEQFMADLRGAFAVILQLVIMYDQNHTRLELLKEIGTNLTLFFFYLILLSFSCYTETNCLFERSCEETGLSRHRAKGISLYYLL